MEDLKLILHLNNLEFPYPIMCCSKFGWNLLYCSELIDWLDSVLRLIGNISANFRRQLLVKIDQFRNFEVSPAPITSLLRNPVKRSFACQGTPFNVPSELESLSVEGILNFTISNLSADFAALSLLFPCIPIWLGIQQNFTILRWLET